MPTKFVDAAKASMFDYSSLYPTIGCYLDHMFMVNGNGMEWVDGELVSRSGDDVPSNSAAMERMIVSGNLPKKPNVPDWLRYPAKIDREFPDDILGRFSLTAIRSCYGYSKGYNKIEKLPDNIPADWLDAAITYLVMVLNTPIQNFSRFGMVRGKNEAERQKEFEYAIKDFEGTQTACREILADLRRRFPNHVYTNVLKTFTFDANRPDAPGTPAYWPLDGSPVENVQDIIKHFKAALLFAYRFEARPGTSEDALDKILDQVAETAITLGQRIVNDDVAKDFRLDPEFAELDAPKFVSRHKLETVTVNERGAYRYKCKCGWYSVVTYDDWAEKCEEQDAEVKDHERQIAREDKKAKAKIVNPVDAIRAVVAAFPKSEGDRTWFNDVLKPHLTEIRKHYRLYRRNLKKDIPYKGFPNGRSSRASCFDPAENFTVSSLEYNHHDQGRDPLETIVGAMVTCMSEQGVRLIQQAFIKACEGYVEPERGDLEKFVHMSDIGGRTLEPLVEERTNQCLDQFDGNGWLTYEIPADNCKLPEEILAKRKAEEDEKIRAYQAQFKPGQLEEMRTSLAKILGDD